MAKIKLQPEASSSNVFTIATPAGSSNRTLTLPDATGTLLTADGDGSSLTGVSSVGGATGVDFNDNVKARFGTGDDLEIYHSGGHSFIHDTGTGDLQLRGTDVRIKSDSDNDDMATFIENGAATLFHSNAAKLATTATGVAVTGGVAIGGTGTANTLDDYEEGTFTMAVQDWSSAGFSIGTVDKAVYTKIGNAVTIWFKAQLVCDSSSPGGGDLKFTGFPFGTTGGYQVYVDVIFDHLTTHQTNMRLSFYGSGGYLYCLDSSGDLVDMTASLGGTNNMSLSFTYMTN